MKPTRVSVLNKVKRLGAVAVLLGASVASTAVTAAPAQAAGTPYLYSVTGYTALHGGPSNGSSVWHWSPNGTRFWNPCYYWNGGKMWFRGMAYDYNATVWVESKYLQNQAGRPPCFR